MNFPILNSRCRKLLIIYIFTISGCSVGGSSQDFSQLKGTTVVSKSSSPSLEDQILEISLCEDISIEGGEALGSGQYEFKVPIGECFGLRKSQFEPTFLPISEVSLWLEEAIEISDITLYPTGLDAVLLSIKMSNTGGLTLCNGLLNGLDLYAEGFDDPLLVIDHLFLHAEYFRYEDGDILSSCLSPGGAGIAYLQLEGQNASLALMADRATLWSVYATDLKEAVSELPSFVPDGLIQHNFSEGLQSIYIDFINTTRFTKKIIGGWYAFFDENQHLMRIVEVNDVSPKNVTQFNWTRFNHSANFEELPAASSLWVWVDWEYSN